MLYSLICYTFSPAELKFPRQRLKECFSFYLIWDQFALLHLPCSLGNVGDHGSPQHPSLCSSYEMLYFKIFPKPYSAINSLKLIKCIMRCLFCPFCPQYILWIADFRTPASSLRSAEISTVSSWCHVKVSFLSLLLTSSVPGILSDVL